MATPEQKLDDGAATIVAIVIIALVVMWSQEQPDTGNPTTTLYRVTQDSARRIARDAALSLYWDDICEYLSGSDTIVACSLSGGGCYDLDADISSCTIDTVYFPNGGFLSIAARIDEFGNASDFDNQGGIWDFEFDVNSMLVDEAIEEWAQAQGYIVE